MLAVLVVNELLQAAAAARALSTFTLRDPVARWFIVEDTLPPEMLADTYAPDITMGDIIGTFNAAPDNSPYWDTQWRTLYPWFVIQMKASPNRVYSYEEADFVFVPVCIGKCGRPWTIDNRGYNTTRDQEFFKNAPNWLPQLGKMPHVAVVNTALDHPFGVTAAGAQPFFLIGPERLPGPISDYNWRFIATPYPSHEHINIYAPERDTPESAFARKTGLIVGTYKNRWAGSDIFQLRPRLFADCTSHPDVCEHYDWPADVPSQAVVYRQYTSHHFCLQPPGDTWIRSAVYDCLVALGRPIVFDDMFEQRMAYADLIDYSELVIKQEMLLPAGYVITDYIKSINNDTAALNALDKLIKYRKVFQYSPNPNHYLINFPHRAQLHKHDDAFTFTMKDLLRRICSQAAGTPQLNPKCT